MTEREWEEIEGKCGVEYQDDSWCCDAFAEKAAREWLEARDVWIDQLRDGRDGWRYMIARQGPGQIAVQFWAGDGWTERVTMSKAYPTRDAAILDAVRIVKRG